MNENKNWRNHALDLVFRLALLALGTLFVLSGISKVLYAREFLAAVTAYDIVGSRGSQIGAVVIPWIEIGIGCCLVSGFYLAGATLSAACILAIFSAALCSVLIRRLDIGCGCFDVRSQDRITAATLMRSVTLLGVACAVYIRILLHRASPENNKV